MAAGSWLRFAIGILLALEVVRMHFSGVASAVALGLGIIYLALVLAYVIFRF